MGKIINKVHTLHTLILKLLVGAILGCVKRPKYSISYYDVPINYTKLHDIYSTSNVMHTSFKNENIVKSK